ncbi:hypothetical protein GCM10010497_58340 [Streptomyces cinereoruber]|uniref:Uncharacterized protein n=1 Tax=Streptomyces cinereoruber TaxID=67260 RepID=A0AAV4KSV7_9ACTN|nr:hypothetical protein [Streptomyces cinereoruber]NIH65497.1 hypothetical protein [Streptomyces cinereoruber]QEV30806.1 hypothetical protein CP977_00030 [Streptomyces cinereoruber]GGR47353.1 hypothetical protein GCM10010497_58340 [Streptomyces cinereoruber]
MNPATTPGTLHRPQGEFLDVALSAMPPEERTKYIERLEAFVEQHSPLRCAAYMTAGRLGMYHVMSVTRPLNTTSCQWPTVTVG